MKPEYYRTFVAMPVTLEPGDLALVEELRHSLRNERISWVRADQYHITLRFLGDTPVDQAMHIGETLRSEVHVNAAVVRLNPPQTFGPRKRPRVLYMGLEPSTILDEAHARVESVIRKCGWPREDHPFRPHLTLGRIRALKDLGGFHRNIEEFGKREPGAVCLNRLVYYRSILGANGAVYTPLAQIPLS